MTHIDVVSDILKASVSAAPDSEFLSSLSHQYLVRGWLTRKQLVGLHQKASRLKGMPAGKMATLQAIIDRMPIKTKSEKPETKPLMETDEKSLNTVQDILEKYPGHKRVLFFKNKLENHEPLSAADLSELERFYKLLVRK